MADLYAEEDTFGMGMLPSACIADEKDGKKEKVGEE